MDGMSVRREGVNLAPDIARAALIFLQRTDLKGSEALVMVQVMRVLEVYANGPHPEAAMSDRNSGAAAEQ